MSDETWANKSLRMALQNIQDEATKPLHAEIARLREALSGVDYYEEVLMLRAENKRLKGE
jgi:hypothetical protein